MRGHVNATKYVNRYGGISIKYVCDVCCFPVGKKAALKGQKDISEEPCEFPCVIPAVCKREAFSPDFFTLTRCSCRGDSADE